MKLTKTLDGYVVRVPDDVVAALGLKDGDVVDLRSTTVTGDPAPREQTVFERLARPLPPAINSIARKRTLGDSAVP